MRTIRLKVVATGLGKNCRLFDTITGDEIRFEGTESIDWTQDRGPNKLRITLLSFDLEATGMLVEPVARPAGVIPSDEQLADALAAGQGEV